MKPRLAKSAIVSVIVLAAVGLWIPRQWHQRQLRKELADLNQQRVDFDQQIADAEKDLESTRRQLGEEKQHRDQARAEVATATRALTQVNPASRWATPPSSLPNWDPESPFVWLPKEMVSQFPVPVFLPNGELRPEVASVLMVDEEQLKDLNPRLRQCLDWYRDIEVAHVKKLEEHLPGIANQEGEKVTIQVPALPKEGAQAKEAFTSALTSSLGDQRADMLKELASHWLDEQFSQFGTEPKTISVLLKPDGSGSISIKSGNSWMSVGLDKSHPEMIYQYLPRHLAPFFKEVLDPAILSAASQAGHQ